MRALVVESLAPNYEGCVLKEIETPKPGPGEVLVKVRAASVNFPDLLMTRGEYQHKPPLPFIPGLEMSGEIEALGDGVERWKVGDAVVGGARIGGFSVDDVSDRVIPLNQALSFMPSVTLGADDAVAAARILGEHRGNRIHRAG